MSRTDELYQMINALLALELSEKTQTQQMPTQQMPTQQMPTQQMPTQQMPTQQMPTQQMPTQQMPTQQMPTQQIPTQQIPTQQMLTQNPYDLGAQIEALTKAVQSNAIMHSEQPKAMTADEALAAIINPPQKGDK